MDGYLIFNMERLNIRERIEANTDYFRKKIAEGASGRSRDVGVKHDIARSNDLKSGFTSHDKNASEFEES